MAIKIAAETPTMNLERILDFLGKPFEAEYVAGAAELLKNCADHAIRTRQPTDPVIYFEIHTPRGTTAPHWTMSCTDFLGTTYEEIDEHLKEWGSEVAASRGDVNFAGFGGHGNGGKFTLRENFTTSELITYRDGRLTVFGFDRDKGYGFDNRYRGTGVAPSDALRIAGLNPDNPDLPEDIRGRLKSKNVDQCRFTVVRGRGFRHARRWRKRDNFWDLLRSHPQAKQVLTRARVIFRDDKRLVDPLLPPEIPAREGFEAGRDYAVPGSVEADGELYELSSASECGNLHLDVAADPFGRTSINHTIDVKGRHLVTIASYKVTELPINNPVGADFIYGTLDCPALDDHGLRTNDRVRLVPNDITNAVLAWVAGRIDELSDELASEENARRQQRDTEATVALTSRLNAWKNKFLTARQITVSVGPHEGEGEGGSGGGGAGGPGGGGNSGDGNGGGDGQGGTGPGSGGTGSEGAGAAGSDGGGGGGGDQERQVPKFPDIRVSGHEVDPFTGERFNLNPRHPVVYQRPEDVRANLWWINAQRPLPARIINEDGAKSPRCRDYIFARFVEVIQNYELTKWDGTTDLSSFLWALTGDIHDSAASDLADVLFETSLDEDYEDPDDPEQAAESVPVA